MSALGTWSRPAFAALLFRALYTAGNVASLVLLPRLLGTSGYGDYGVLIAAETIVYGAASLGTLTTFSRFVPEHAAGGRTGAILALFHSAIAVKLASGLVAGLALAAMIRVWGLAAGPGLLALAAAAAALHVAGETAYHLRLGLGHLRPWTTGLLLQIGVRVVAIAAFATRPGTAAFAAVIGGTFVSELVVALVGVFYARHWWAGLMTNARLASLRPYLRFAGGFLLTAVLLALFRRVGILALRGTAGTGGGDTIGFFHLATQAQLSLVMLLQALTTAYQPTLVHIHLSPRPERVPEAIGVGIGAFVVAVGVLAVALQTVGAPVLAWVVGPPFGRAPEVLVPAILAGVPSAIVVGSSALPVLAKTPGRFNAALLLMVGSFLLLLQVPGTATASGILMAQGIAAAVGVAAIVWPPTFDAGLRRTFVLATGGALLCQLAVGPIRSAGTGRGVGSAAVATAAVGIACGVLAAAIGLRRARRLRRPVSTTTGRTAAAPRP